MKKRNRIKPTDSLEKRLQKFAEESRRAARLLPPGKERTELLRKAKQAETTAHITDWVTSPGLRPTS
jgi:hypothetical protein